MNTMNSYMLTCIIEEAGELIQAAAKALKHGLDGRHPEKVETNFEAIVREYRDVQGAMKMFYEEASAVEFDQVDEEAIEAKIKKIKSYM